jgi:CPA2 family monovalent cation:H+ antiporter-2
MHAGPEFPFLRETLLFLALAGVLIPLLQRLRINQILGFLAVGAVLGPAGLGAHVDAFPALAWITFGRDAGMQALGELGVIFLMFLIGLELSGARMWALRGWVFGAGTAQVVLTTAVLGTAAWWLGATPRAAVVIGGLLALSSTAVVMQILNERRLMPTPQGQATFAILMLQDLAVVPLLLLVDLLAERAPGTSPLLLVGTVTLKSVIAIGLIWLVGRRVVGPLFRTFAQRHQPEVFVALTLLVALSIAGITAAAGLSMALGAFLAGLLLAETEYRHEVEVTVEPFKGLLMGLFFMTVGMAVALDEVLRQPFAIAGAVLGLFLVKGLVNAAILRAGGLRTGAALEAGLLLGQGGEFAFVLIGAATAAAILDPAAGRFLVLVVSASLFLTPLVAHVGTILRRRTDALRAAGDAELAEPLGEDTAGHVIIAGCGRVGQLVADVLAREGVRFVAIEQDAHVVARLRRRGVPVVFGNAARPELLRKLRADTAAAVLVTMDQPAPAMHTVRGIRDEYPALPVYARSRDERHAHELRAAGATLVVPETLEAALQLAAASLGRVGMADGAVAAVVDAERDRRVGATPQG